MPDVTVMAVGDVSVDLPDNFPSFEHVAPLLKSGDVVFGNCEYVYSEQLAPSVTHLAMHSAPPAQAAVLGEAGFDVMSTANNHILDAGYAGMEGTMQTLLDLGIKPVGTGANIAEATAPAVIESNGARVAFLAFCTVFPVGYEARPNRGGLAPLRVDTFYKTPAPNVWDPGIAPVIKTVPLAEDVQRYRDAIAVAKEMADFVVVSQHWGMNPEVREMLVPPTRTYEHVFRSALEDYELELSRLGVEFGADAIVAHHQTSLNGIELYQGKPIFYGLSALVHHFHKGGSIGDDEAIDTTLEVKGFPYWNFRRPETLITGIAVMRMADDGIDAGLVPAMILPDGGVEPLKPGDNRVPAVRHHLEDKIAQEELGTKVTERRYKEWVLLEIREG